LIALGGFVLLLFIKTKNLKKVQTRFVGQNTKVEKAQMRVVRQNAKVEKAPTRVVGQNAKVEKAPTRVVGQNAKVEKAQKTFLNFLQLNGSLKKVSQQNITSRLFSFKIC